jgi:hypothetical protein
MSRIVFKEPYRKKDGLCLNKLALNNKCDDEGTEMVNQFKHKLVDGKCLNDQDIDVLKKYSNNKYFDIKPIQYKGLRKPIIVTDANQEEHCNTKLNKELSPEVIPKPTTNPNSTMNPNRTMDTEPNSILPQYTNNNHPIYPPINKYLYSNQEEEPLNLGQLNKGCWKRIGNNKMCKLQINQLADNLTCFNSHKKCDEQNGLGYWKGNYCWGGPLVKHKCYNKTINQCTYPCQWKEIGNV